MTADKMITRLNRMDKDKLPIALPYKLKRYKVTGRDN